MKKLILLITLLLTITLSGCETAFEELDYTDFPDSVVTNYSALEDIKDQRYVAYYYSKNCGHCADIKQDILNFFNHFKDMPFYILDTSLAKDVSGYDEFIGTPTVMVIANGVVLESYVGTFEIKDFIKEYDDFDKFELDYDLFLNQHLTNYDQVLEIESDSYILYYYLKDCPHCQRTKSDFLAWAWERDISDIYFMDGATVSDPDNIPTELIVLNSGTPILVVMTNGEFADEYYSGTEAVIEYINKIGMGPITTDEYVE